MLNGPWIGLSTALSSASRDGDSQTLDHVRRPAAPCAMASSSAPPPEPRGAMAGLARLLQQPLADAVGAARGLLHGLRDGSNMYQIDILKRLQRQTSDDIMELRERQDDFERVIWLSKSTKVGPFAEESTHAKAVINIAVSCCTSDSSEAESGTGSRFVFQTPVGSFSAELVADHRYMSQEKDRIGSPLILSKVMCLSDINDTFSVATVPIGARCDDFSTNPNLQEEHWLASLRSSLKPPLLMRNHRYAAGLILRSKKFAASLAELISAAGRPGDAGESGGVCTEFGQISCQLADDIELTLSAALHGPSVVRRRRKPTSGGCIDVELKVDEDSRIGAWVEINKKSASGLLKWALTLSDTPGDDLGWGVSLRRGTEAKPQLFQVEGFLNLHLGRNAAVRPGVIFNVDGSRCTADLAYHWSWCWSL